MTQEEAFIPYEGTTYPDDEMLERSHQFYNWMDQRRSVRDYSEKPVPKEIIEHIVMSASTAPSGAHKQPWTFCLISKKNPELRKKIREAAEKEERENYETRMSQRWLNDLKPMGTDAVKPFLEEAPWLIVVFKRAYELVGDQRNNNYYVNESVGIACGMLLTAIHNAGLVALTHTPSPMNFLANILDRPHNERAFLLIPVGYPKENAQIPDLKRKTLSEVVEYY